MLEFVVAYEVLSLCSLATAGTAKKEEDVRLGKDAQAVVFTLNGTNITCDSLHPIK
jgi:hypothetical protein